MVIAWPGSGPAWPAGRQAPPPARRLCEVCCALAGVSGATVVLVVDAAPYASLGATDEVSSRLEELQRTLGEGPAVDAHVLGRPVMEDDLAVPLRARWTAFAPAAIEAGARGVFAFPVRVGVARLGALLLHRDRPGPLGDEAHADALVVADVAALLVLGSQQASAADCDATARELWAATDLQAAVHNAAGMVSVQLDVPITEALLRLRSYAFVSDRPLAQVAADVIARKVRIS